MISSKKNIVLFLFVFSLKPSFFIRDSFVANPIKKITQDSNPKLYSLVQKISKKANYEIDNIFVKKAKYKTIEKDIVGYKIAKKWRDIVPLISGADLIFNKECLLNFSDQELEGLLAITFSEPLESYFLLPIIFLGMFYAEFKFFMQSNQMRKFIISKVSESRCAKLIATFFAFIPFFATLSYNFSLQKIQDLKALKLTSKSNILQGINALKCYNEKINKLSFSDIVDSSHWISKAILGLTYFVRPYTTKERIDYVQRAA